MSASRPLVSCIMPTYERRRFVPRAVDYFLRQDYPERELLVLDDGADPVADLVPDHPLIRYVRLDEKKNLGAKLNLGCELARGDLVAHWDDDDWYAPRRLSYQVDTLLRDGIDVCGINHLLYYDLDRQRAFVYRYPPEQRTWLIGSSLAYRKDHWRAIRFAEIDVGMDGLFVWATEPRRISVLEDHTIAVHTIHPANASPKRTDGPWWSECPADGIRAVLGDDWRFYASDAAAPADVAHAAPAARAVRVAAVEAAPAPPAPVRNVYACLVHEELPCVVDLVRNLRHADPSSTIVLYNGGPDRELLEDGVPFGRWDVRIHPDPRPMAWGTLHGYALDCMRLALEDGPFDTLTIVDSDQLATRPGFSERLRGFLDERPGAGVLGSAAGPQADGARVGPVVAALQEMDRWRPFLRRFPRGEELFPHWTFWPATVFTADACREIVRAFDTDEQLRDLVRHTSIWATEEVILPTMAALLGFEVVQSPSSYDFVRYRVPYSPAQVEEALRREDVFFLHPVPRRYDDAIRARIRDRLDHYPAPPRGAAAAPDGPRTHPGGAARVTAGVGSGEPGADPTPLLLPGDVLARMREVEGWLSDAEGDLLLAAARHALSAADGPHALVEVGSYCGRATTVLGWAAREAAWRGADARVFAVDTFDGRLGGLDVGVRAYPPSLEKFTRTIRGAGLQDVVETVQGCPHRVPWSRPVTFLLLDGLHDYVSVARDFHHFAPFLRAGAIVAFHDYADYFPGVRTFVDELLRDGGFREVRRVETLLVAR